MSDNVYKALFNLKKFNYENIYKYSLTSSEKEYYSQSWNQILNKVLIARDLDIDYLNSVENKRLALYRSYENAFNEQFKNKVFYFDSKNKKRNEACNDLFQQCINHYKFTHCDMKIVVTKVCIGLNNLKSTQSFSLADIEKMWNLIDKKIVTESSYWATLMARLNEYKNTIRTIPQFETTKTYSNSTYYNDETFEEIAYEYCLNNSIDPYRILSTENFNKTALSSYLTDVERILKLPMTFSNDAAHNLRCKRIFRELIEQQNAYALYDGRFSLTITKKIEHSTQQETKVLDIVDVVRLFGG